MTTPLRSKTTDRGEVSASFAVPKSQFSSMLRHNVNVVVHDIARSIKVGWNIRGKGPRSPLGLDYGVGNGRQFQQVKRRPH